MKIRETFRDDGLRIISVKVPFKRIRFELTCRAGSAYDPPEKDGFFHYFEHMAFRGTSRRIEDEITSFSQRNLLMHNAYTAQTETCYFGEAVFTKFPQLCDLICDTYFNSTLPAGEIEKEKEVILNEIARDNDDDKTAAFIELWKLLWRKNPLRKFGVGTPEGIKSVTREELLEAQKNWYVPLNTIALAIGNIAHETLVAELKKHIPEKCDGYRRIEHQTWEDEYDAPPSSCETILKRPGREKAIVLVGCKFPLIKNDERKDLTAEFLEELLVSSMASRIWKELRNKRGIIYASHGGIGSEPPLGCYFAVVAETLPARIDEVKGLIPSLLTAPFNDKQAFEEVKESLNDRITLGYETPSQWSFLLHKKINARENPEKLEGFFRRNKKMLHSISLEEVEALRAETMKPEKFAMVIL